MKSTENNALLNKLPTVIDRISEIEKLMEDSSLVSQPEKMASTIREYRRLTEIRTKLDAYRDILERISEADELIRSETDIELIEMARQDLEDNEKLGFELDQEIKLLLIPSDPQDEKNAIVEIRAGTGGEEAALFAGDLYRMYSKYVERCGWKQEILGSSPTELGGFKEITFAVSGQDVYGQLKFESGVHRVQRVPTTETSGRIHTSAASVAVLPEAEDVDVDFGPNDLRIDVYRSSGPGGQSVNTTDSAVRITHIPTGMVVTCQDEKSQHKNKSKALKVLRARLYDLKRKEEEAKIRASRRSMIGSGDRSAKIRTFNYPQGRVTDHRINLTLYKLQEILSGNLDEIIEQLQAADRNQKLKDET